VKRLKYRRNQLTLRGWVQGQFSDAGRGRTSKTWRNVDDKRRTPHCVVPVSSVRKISQQAQLSLRGRATLRVIK